MPMVFEGPRRGPRGGGGGGVLISRRGVQEYPHSAYCVSSSDLEDAWEYWLLCVGLPWELDVRTGRLTRTQAIYV